MVGGGGGILNDTFGHAEILNSAIHGNKAKSNDAMVAGAGGGIFNWGTLKLVNSTVSNNEAITDGPFPGYGGAIYNSASATGTLVILSSTITQNTADGILGGVYGNISLLRNSIIAENK